MNEQYHVLLHTFNMLFWILFSGHGVYTHYKSSNLVPGTSTQQI